VKSKLLYCTVLPLCCPCPLAAAVLTLTKANRGITAQEVTELLKRLIQDAKDQGRETRRGGGAGR